MKRISALLGTSLVLGMLSVPVCVLGDEDTISVTVSVYDYNAVDAGVSSASVDGVILDRYSVEVPVGTSDLDAVKKALEDNDISITVTEGYYGSYISEINGLSEFSNPDAEPDYSGWMVAFNGSFDNYGIGSLGVGFDGKMSDGDDISFHYSMDGGIDLGSSYYGNPIINSLTVDDVTVTLHKTVSYDDNWNTIFDFSAENADLTGDGSQDNPFELKLSLGEIESSKLPVSFTSSRYFKVEGLDTSHDFSNPLKFTVSAESGMISYYEVTADYTVKNDDLQSDILEDDSSDTGDMSNFIPITFAALMAAAVSLASRKYSYN